MGTPWHCHIQNLFGYAGLQISLNYLMKFNAELAPNSSRDYLEGDGGMGGCDLPCTMTYVHIPGFCCFLACARRVALLFGGRISKVRPALRKAGRALFWRSNLRSATCLAQGGSRFSLRGKFLYSSPVIWPRFRCKTVRF